MKDIKITRISATLLVSRKIFFPSSLAPCAVYPDISPRYIPLKAVVLFLFLNRPSRGFPLHMPLWCGRDYLSEENSLSYGDLFQTRGTTTEKSWLLMSQNIIRNDKRAFSPSHAAPNSSAEFTPNNSANYSDHLVHRRRVT